MEQYTKAVILELSDLIRTKSKYILKQDITFWKKKKFFSKEMLILVFILFSHVPEAQLSTFFSSRNGKDGRPADLAVRPLHL